MYSETRKFWWHEYLKFRRCLIDMVFSSLSLAFITFSLVFKFTKVVTMGEKIEGTIEIEDPKSEGYIVESYFVRE